MIGEIALLIKGLDTACKLVRTGLDRKKDAANIQKNRDFNLAQANRRKIIKDRKDEDFYLAVKLIAGLVILMIAITGLVFTLAIN